MHTCLCLYRGVCLSSRRFLTGRFCPGFLSGRFCLGWFLSVPLLSEYIHYNRKLSITFNFRFHMYEIFLKCDVTCSWTPLSLSQAVAPLLTLSSVTYFMDGPKVERWFPVSFLPVFLWRHLLQRRCFSPSVLLPWSRDVGFAYTGENLVVHHTLCFHRETTCRWRGGQLGDRGF